MEEWLRDYAPRENEKCLCCAKTLRRVTKHGLCGCCSQRFSKDDARRRRRGFPAVTPGQWSELQSATCRICQASLERVHKHRLCTKHSRMYCNWRLAQKPGTATGADAYLRRKQEWKLLRSLRHTRILVMDGRRYAGSVRCLKTPEALLSELRFIFGEARKA